MEDMEINKRFWLNRPTFVTGATGLVGSWLIKKLLFAGADIVCLVRDWVPQSELVLSGDLSRVKVVRGDIQDKPLLERILAEYEIETVIHLAAQTIVGIANRNPISTFESNIKGTWTLLEACRQNTKVQQIIIASSDKAYGDQDILPYCEETPLEGKHPYDVSKSCADLIAQTYAVTYELTSAQSALNGSSRVRCFRGCFISLGICPNCSYFCTVFRLRTFAFAAACSCVFPLMRSFIMSLTWASVTVIGSPSHRECNCSLTPICGHF